MQDQIDAANKLYGEAKTANANFTSSERPWFAAEIIVPTLGGEPKATCKFTNRGRRPARIEEVACQDHPYTVLPPNPAYTPSGTSSKAFIVPGADASGEVTLTKNGAPLTQEGIKALYSRGYSLFIYGKIEYVDVGDGSKHYAHVCMEYFPVISGTQPGFYQCDKYYDAD
jgi:hypothetical protein